MGVSGQDRRMDGGAWGRSEVELTSKVNSTRRAVTGGTRGRLERDFGQPAGKSRGWEVLQQD